VKGVRRNVAIARERVLGGVRFSGLWPGERGLDEGGTTEGRVVKGAGVLATCEAVKRRVEEKR
jgi:hypothetical protein